jgi:cytochrome c
MNSTIPPLLVLTAALTLAACSPASPQERLASSQGCLSCHDVQHRQVGPAFVEVARRYQGDDREATANRLAGKIRGGGVGTWGRLVMPPQTQVSEDEARQLATWIAGLADGSPPPK